MMHRRLSRVIALLFAMIPLTGFAQAGADYENLVQQGKTQLQTGSNDAALASANAAIKLDANRWEAYALAGGALINLKRCDEAKADLNEAIKRAPEAKQPALQALTGQCHSVSGSSSDVAQSSGPTLQETSNWLAKTLRSYGGQCVGDYVGCQSPAISEDVTDAGIADNCTFYFQGNVYKEKEKGSNVVAVLNGHYKVSIPLGAVKDLSISTGQRQPSHVSFSTSPVSAIQRIYNDGSLTAEDNSQLFLKVVPHAQLGGESPQSPEEITQRVQKALKHGIDLCQRTYVNRRNQEPF